MFSRAFGFMIHQPVVPGILIAMFALVLVAAVPQLPENQALIPFADAEFFIEVNSTDGDAGVQLFLDGEQWESLRMYDPYRKILLDVRARRSLGTQGLTEFFFESAEPSFDEVSLEEFLGRFPEGEYTFIGRGVEGDTLEATAKFTHVIPEGPSIILSAEGEPLKADEVVIEWEPVTSPEGVEIVSYEVIVSGDESLGEFRILLPGTATRVEVPEEVFDPEVSDYKFEVLAKEVSGNQTITETEFEIETGDQDQDEGEDGDDKDDEEEADEEEEG